MAVISGTLDCGSSRVLYALHPAPTMQVIAFPGDGVPWPGSPPWSTLPNAKGLHAHAGTLLAVLHKRSQSTPAAVFVVEPASTGPTCISYYTQFLPSLTPLGEPTNGSYEVLGRKAWLELASVLSMAWEAAGQTQIPALPVHLVGFSKGAVVLNQLLAEMNTVPLAPAQGADQSEESEGLRLLRCLTQVHFVDAGVASKGAHLTEPHVIDAIGRYVSARAAPAIFIHGTPRQWRDPHRKWLAKERDLSVTMLKTAGVSVAVREYFASEQPSMEMHFGCVIAFEWTADRHGAEPEVERLGV